MFDGMCQTRTNAAHAAVRILVMVEQPKTGSGLPGLILIRRKAQMFGKLSLYLSFYSSSDPMFDGVHQTRTN